MKKFAAFFRWFELDVYADTEEEARKKALAGFSAQLESELVVVDVNERTERCEICQYTYQPSEIVNVEGEQFCLSCYGERYQEEINLNDIDIPF